MPDFEEHVCKPVERVDGHACRIERFADYLRFSVGRERHQQLNNRQLSALAFDQQVLGDRFARIGALEVLAKQNVTLGSLEASQARLKRDDTYNVIERGFDQFTFVQEWFHDDEELFHVVGLDVVALLGVQHGQNMGEPEKNLIKSI